MFMHKYVLIMFLLFLLQACGSAAVQPWEKDELAKREMLIVPDPRAGSGGCGCN